MIARFIHKKITRTKCRLGYYENLTRASRSNTGTVSKPSIETDDDLIELSCTDISETTEDETIKIRPFEGLKNREATVNLGPIDWVTPEKAKLMTIAGRMCRCSDEGKEGNDWDRVSLKEVGHQALSGSCNRAKMNGQCKKTYRFADVTKVPQGELMTKAAIYTGGPIVATLNLHHSMYNFDAQNGEKIYHGIAESNDGHSEHAIVLFGWGVDDNTNEKFWWARNSWGDSWPRNTNTPGIFKVSRGENRNNIETKERAFANAVRSVRVRSARMASHSLMNSSVKLRIPTHFTRKRLTFSNTTLEHRYLILRQRKHRS